MNECLSFEEGVRQMPQANYDACMKLWTENATRLRAKGLTEMADKQDAQVKAFQDARGV